MERKEWPFDFSEMDHVNKCVKVRLSCDSIAMKILLTLKHLVTPSARGTCLYRHSFFLRNRDMSRLATFMHTVPMYTKARFGISFVSTR